MTIKNTTYTIKNNNCRCEFDDRKDKTQWLMQEEIKEILDRLENYDNYKYRNDNGRSYKEIEGWEIDLLLDYITNLQEELEYQKQAENEYNEKHLKLMNMYSDLKSRNEEAIEYIYELKQNAPDEEALDKLLNLLQGVDKE